MGEWITQREHAPMPYQPWRAFPPDAIVQVRNAYGDTRIGPAGTFWWGHEVEFGEIGEGVIVSARRLDKPKEPRHG